MARERVPGARGLVLAAIAALALSAAWWLELRPADLWPSASGLQVLADFVARAASPALTSEADFVPPGVPPLLLQAAAAAGRTVLFAAAAMALALVLGVVLGFFASTAWWAGDPAGGGSRLAKVLRRTLWPVVYLIVRVLIALLRSVHEILWAVLFLAALGLNDTAALLAIALPFGGTLAKIFSEMVDEAPRDAAEALRATGASGLTVFFFGLVPRALPDMIAYAFYRFECALRASAVLGFFGFETLGLYLRQSFVASNYGEVWTYLYTLLGLVLVFDLWSGALRQRLVGAGVGGCRPAAVHDVAALRRARPRSRFVRVSLWTFVALLVASWLAGGFGAALEDAFSPRRMANLARFWQEVRPFPLHGEPWDGAVAWAWARDLWHARGAEAAMQTFAVSLVAIATAGVFGLLLCLPAARTFVHGDGLVPAAAPSRLRTALERVVYLATRAGLIVLRSVPEYLWAFLLLAILGPNPWPVVLALALHNAGILGRLGAEAVENVEAGPLRALRAAGAGRLQVAVVGLWPLVLPRFLLYLFYRWETCVREATVLGMLGLVALGYWISDARTRGQYDVMVFYIVLGAGIVLAGDLVSAVVRRLVR